MESTVSNFRKLHESGCFVIPNPWNRGTAVILAGLGYKALATTSAGLGFARGEKDEVGLLSLKTTLDNIREIVEATALPVNADFQEGFATTPEGVRENVSLCADTGVAGLSIEDATGEAAKPLFEKSIAIERMQAAKEALISTPEPPLLTGRCEAWLVGAPNPLDTALERLVAYADAGADCLYAPGVRNLKEIATLVRAVAPKPLNVLASALDDGITLQDLADVGVRRISIGSSFSRIALGAFIKSAKSVAETGEFFTLKEAASFQELNDMLG